MDPRLSEAEEALRERAAKEATGCLAPIAVTADLEVAAPRAALAALGTSGMLGICVPEEFGGGGGGLVELALVCEQLGAASASAASIVVGHAVAASIVADGGNDEQRAKILPELAVGTRLAALGLDGAASLLDDPAPAALLAIDGEEATLEGSISAVAGATVADRFVIAAQAAEDGSELRWIVADASGDGIAVGDEEHKLGLNGSGMAAVELSAVRVDSGSLLSSGAAPEALADSALDRARVGHAAICVGIGRAALEVSTKYVSESDAALGRSQQVQWMLADMATETEAARLLTWYAASREGVDELREAAGMARLVAADAAVRATRSAVQICGRAGSARAAGIERLYRDAKAMEVHHGASEAQRRAVARQLLPDLVG